MSTWDHRIAVVEDEEMIRESVIEFLADQGYAAFGAVDGRDALEKLKAADPPPCLILLDLMMPVMDGRAFREHQLQTPRLSRIPVVVFSAYQNAAQTAKDLGVAGFLAKPVDLSRLLLLIRQLCPGA